MFGFENAVEIRQFVYQMIVSMDSRGFIICHFKHCSDRPASAIKRMAARGIMVTILFYSRISWSGAGWLLSRL